jgi:hypothetical protein
MQQVSKTRTDKYGPISRLVLLHCGMEYMYQNIKKDHANQYEVLITKNSTSGAIFNLLKSYFIEPSKEEFTASVCEAGECFHIVSTLGLLDDEATPLCDGCAAKSKEFGGIYTSDYMKANRSSEAMFTLDIGRSRFYTKSHPCNLGCGNRVETPTSGCVECFENSEPVEGSDPTKGVCESYKHKIGSHSFPRSHHREIPDVPGEYHLTVEIEVYDQGDDTLFNKTYQLNSGVSDMHNGLDMASALSVDDIERSSEWTLIYNNDMHIQSIRDEINGK